jgi:hypothetical protein
LLEHRRPTGVTALNSKARCCSLNKFIFKSWTTVCNLSKMIAFDGSSLSRKGVELIAACPLFVGLPIHVITSGEAGKGLRKQLEWAKTTLETAGFEVHTSVAGW